ncbi:MAG: PIN domain-containing protein [Coriobacteriia bacterium]|nr:PIN domain-containing protein [Coriobacteriia bacterium]
MTGKKQAKKRPASYFVDFENVRGAGLNGVEGLAKGDRVFVLYGSKDSALKLEQVQNVMHSPAKVEFIKVATGKHDALDFQLVALLFMNMKKKRDYFVISKDTGFDFAIRMAKVRGFENVYRRETISGATLEPKKLPQGRRKPAKRLPQPKEATPQGRTAQRSESKPAAAPAEPAPEPAAKVPQAQAAAPEATQPANDAQAPQQPKQGDAAQPDKPKPSRRRRRKPAAKATQKDPYRIEIERVLAKNLGGLPTANKVDAIVDGLQKCDTRSRFYNHLRGALGNEQGLGLYRDVKSLFDQLQAVERPAQSNE